MHCGTCHERNFIWGQRFFQGSWGYDCLWLYWPVSLFYLVTSLKYMYWTELTLDASDSFNFIYKPGLSSLVQILHHLTPGSEGDGSFNNLISALGLEGTLSKNKYIINQNCLDILSTWYNIYQCIFYDGRPRTNVLNFILLCCMSN